MKHNGDLYLYALVNFVTGFTVALLGVNKLLRDADSITGYFAIFGGVCLVCFSWMVISSAVFRTHGATPWWSSRRLFRVSKFESKMV